MQIPGYFIGETKFTSALPVTLPGLSIVLRRYAGIYKDTTRAS